MNKKYLIGFVFLLAVLVWIVLRIGAGNLKESESLSEGQVKNNSGNEFSERPKTRNNSRSRPENKKAEWIARDRAKGYLQPDEVDWRIHTEVSKGLYTERIEVDLDFQEKIFVQLEKHNDILTSEREAKEKGEVARIGRLISLVVEGGEEEKQKNLDTLQGMADRDAKLLALFDEAITEVSKSENLDARGEIIKKFSQKIALRRKALASINSVQEAYDGVKKTIHVPIFLPRYFETETHYIFSVWKDNHRGSSIRKKDGLTRGWQIDDDE